MSDSVNEKINKVEVTILDDQYIIKGGDPPEYIEMLASQMNKRLQRVQGINPRLSNYQTAILTALNILDEYTKLQQEYQSLVELLEEPKDKAKK
ncbi:MAG: cell division protein ZapA [Bacillota bacterium]